MNFEKSKTSDFWKKWKKLLDISSFYTCVPKTQSYEVQFLRYRVRENFLSFWAIFCSFAPLLTPKIKIWKKCEKHPDIYPILLYMCTINQDHMMYGFWDMKCNRQNFLSSWTVFCPKIWCATDGGTDGQTDRQKKWHIEVGAHLKMW